jgi:hypothetical protein
MPESRLWRVLEQSTMTVANVSKDIILQLVHGLASPDLPALYPYYRTYSSPAVKALENALITQALWARGGATVEWPRTQGRLGE